MEAAVFGQGSPICGSNSRIHEDGIDEGWSPQVPKGGRVLCGHKLKGFREVRLGNLLLSAVGVNTTLLPRNMRRHLLASDRRSRRCDAESDARLFRCPVPPSPTAPLAPERCAVPYSRIRPVCL